MNEWVISQPIDGIEITAGEKTLWICGGKALLDQESPGSRTADSRLGRILPLLIPQLLELDLATLEGADVRLRYEQLVSLPSHGIDAFSELFAPFPFRLEVKTLGSLGFESNRYNIHFYLNGERVEPEIRGCLLKYRGSIYILNQESFDLITTANNFNLSLPEEKKSPEAFKQFAQIKRLASESDALTDKFLKSRSIVIPAQIGVDLVEEEDERISFAPKIDGVPTADFQAAVRRSGTPQKLYSFHGEGREQISVVLNDEQQEVLARMQEVRRVGGYEKTKVLRDPHAVFDGVIGSVNLDDFGPRVRGIGDFPFVVQPFIRGSVTGIFDDINRADTDSPGKFDAGLICRYADGTEQLMEFSSPIEIAEFRDQVVDAFRSGKGQIDYAGKSISLDKQFVDGVEELHRKTQPRTSSSAINQEPAKGKYLLIYTNEDDLEFGGDPIDAAPPSELELPKSLKDDVVLKDHQKRGVAWLQHSFRLRRQGCLLADDMGLGKTLQLLIFLAWLIERGDVVSDTGDVDLPPWKPILVVAPVILIENETWLNDMKRFFKGDGAIFTPWLTLRGSELQRLKLKDKKGKGKETKIGEATLNLDELRKHRVVLTNYETVINYQHSFAKMRDDWSVIITDEAQEYKTPNTKISHALKSLSPGFRVACTGTPVETRLFDVWNIFDFLQPGKLLGSAKSFCDRYEKPLEALEETKAAIAELKERLLFSSPNSFILRRDKGELVDLPKKHEYRLECKLSPTQRETHLDLLRRASVGGQGNHPFSLISDFLRVYQHPSLVPRYNPASPDQAIEECDKLRVLIDTLRSIKLKGEKALIFTRSLDMQQILVSALNHRFGLSVNVVNGSTKQGKSKGSGAELSGADRTRRGIIDKFQNSEGFNVLILSPDVAGMGLTLTEANHVFHYGRWWNPAKEAQATDRVYRIGQEKDVHIYYLIAKDVEGKFQTFDEKLDILLQRRLALASDFLAPIPSEDDLTKEFMKDLFGSESVLELGD